MSDLTEKELWYLRAIIQRIGWGKFMCNVGSLMAEQADKVECDSEQDKNLFQCSNTVYALDPFFQKCGHFDYRRLDLVPEEYKPLLEANPPCKD
jgi:hypothetical protein